MRANRRSLLGLLGAALSAPALAPTARATPLQPEPDPVSVTVQWSSDGVHWTSSDDPTAWVPYSFQEGQHVQELKIKNNSRYWRVYAGG